MKAAVLEKINAPLAIMDCEMPDRLGHGQVLVKLLVAGICGAQLQEIAGHKGNPDHLPHLLGHEGCGMIESIGPGVTTVKPGDKVVLHWKKGAGCDVVGASYEQNMEIRWDSTGRETGRVDRKIKSGPITTFSDCTIVSENRVTAIPYDVPNDFACLLGCSLSTALGVAENEARIKFGESVLIIGCGGLGLSLILAAKLAHAYPIVAIDKCESKKTMAKNLGAMFCDSECRQDAVQFDVIIDTTGHAPHIAQLAPSGRYIMVGQPDPYVAYLQVGQASRLFEGNGKTIRATQGGCFSPETDIPRYVNLWRSGALNESNVTLVTHRVTLENINHGLDLVRTGQGPNRTGVGRVMIDFAQ